MAVTFRARREVENKRMGVLGGVRRELLKWDSEASIVIGLPKQSKSLKSLPILVVACLPQLDHSSNG